MQKNKYLILKKIIKSKRWDIDVEKGIVIGNKGIFSQKSRNGYIRTATTWRGKVYYFYGHQIIATAGGLNSTSMTINHINGDKTDNRLVNLEIMSKKDNLKHAFETGLNNKSGEHHHNTHLRNADIILIRELYLKGVYQKDIAKTFSITQQTVSKIISKQLWRDVLC